MRKSYSEFGFFITRIFLASPLNNFRNDVNATGDVSGNDVNLIKAQVGTTLP
jgi:hypothetical protein